MPHISCFAECWQDLLAFTNTPMILCEMDGTIVSINDAIGNIVGYKDDDLRTLNVSKILSAESAGLILEFKQQPIEEGILERPYKLELIRKDERHLTVESAVRVLKDKNDQAIGLLMKMVDTNDHKQVEEELKEKELLYRGTLDNMLEACIIFDHDFRYIYLNDAAIKYDPRGKDNLLGHTLIEMYPAMKGSKELPAFQRSMNERVPQRYESKFYTNDGTELWYEIAIQPVSEGVCMLGLDVTERNRRQRDMRFYIDQVMRVQEEERKRIARELHDEIAQRLATLSLGIDTVIRDGQELTPGIVETLRHLRESVDQLSEEVNRLSHALRPAILDQLGLIPAGEHLLGELAKRGKIEAQLEVIGEERRLSPEVELGLYRIIQEAVNNAGKHSGAANLIVMLEFGSDKVRIVVKDDGKGFNAKRWRKKATETGKLGLLGMEERAHLLNGTLSIESKLGDGTTVTVELGRKASAPFEQVAMGQPIWLTD